MLHFLMGNYVLLVHVDPILAETQALGQNQAMSAKGKLSKKGRLMCS